MIKTIICALAALGVTSGALSLLSGRPEPFIGWLFVTGTLAVFGVIMLVVER